MIFKSQAKYLQMMLKGIKKASRFGEAKFLFLKNYSIKYSSPALLI